MDKEWIRGGLLKVFVTDSFYQLRKIELSTLLGLETVNDCAKFRIFWLM